jgi:hypothetical protein
LRRCWRRTRRTRRRCAAAPLRGCAAMLLHEAARALRLWPRQLFDPGAV